MREKQVGRGCSLLIVMRLVMRVSFLPGEKEQRIPAKFVFYGLRRQGAGKREWAVESADSEVRKSCNYAAELRNFDFTFPSCSDLFCYVKLGIAPVPHITITGGRQNSLSRCK